MVRLLATLAALTCLIWLLFFTQVTILQILLIAGYVIYDYIGQRK